MKVPLKLLYFHFIFSAVFYITCENLVTAVTKVECYRILMYFAIGQVKLVLVHGAMSVDWVLKHHGIEVHVGGDSFSEDSTLPVNTSHRSYQNYSQGGRSGLS